MLTNPGSQSSVVTEQYGYAGGVRAAQPLGYWRLEDHAGTSAADWAATPHPGTVTGGVTRGQPGALADGSLAMGFNGQAGAQVEVAAISGLDTPTAVTVEVWTKLPDASAGGSIVHRVTENGPSYHLFSGAGYWYFRVRRAPVWAGVDADHC